MKKQIAIWWKKSWGLFRQKQIQNNDLTQQDNTMQIAPTIIIGLGNPGEKYLDTRHNAGFLAVDAIARHCDADTFTLDKKYAALTAEVFMGGRKIILAKPTTFMNRSGETVRALCDFYKADITSDIIILHDDLDIAIGDYKDAQNRSAAGHNGIIDIIEKMGTKDFRRIRIGIENRTQEQKQNMSGTNYVLGKFTREEMTVLEKVYTELITQTF
jgi:peptidyl-tRNA hydrolase, PTH1 family